ncbi:MAG: hypothetical protein QOH73_869 [Gaiellaceae bacterium]|jgi:hypothetical protein|nr:hypothetical protein [Gaiellaceae bacterium]
MRVSERQQAFVYEAQSLAIRWEEDSGYWLWDEETGDDVVWFALQQLASPEAGDTTRLGRVRIVIELLDADAA